MTVKELKEILDGCNDDAIVIATERNSIVYLLDHQVYHTGEEVIIDVDGSYGKSEQMRAYAEAHGIPSVEIKTSGAYPSFQNFVTKWTMKKDDE